MDSCRKNMAIRAELRLLACLTALARLFPSFLVLRFLHPPYYDTTGVAPARPRCGGQLGQRGAPAWCPVAAAWSSRTTQPSPLREALTRGGGGGGATDGQPLRSECGRRLEGGGGGGGGGTVGVALLSRAPRRSENPKRGLGLLFGLFMIYTN
eukprot:SAG31_NODE_985_length_10549_cov_2.605339_9_plen_153_part_00